MHRLGDTYRMAPQDALRWLLRHPTHGAGHCHSSQRRPRQSESPNGARALPRAAHPRQSSGTRTHFRVPWHLVAAWVRSCARSSSRGPLLTPQVHMSRHHHPAAETRRQPTAPSATSPKWTRSCTRGGSCFTLLPWNKGMFVDHTVISGRSESTFLGRAVQDTQNDTHSFQSFQRPHSGTLSVIQPFLFVPSGVI